MNRSTDAWIKKYRRHFADNVARLGGIKDISSERRLVAREAAVLQTELDYIAQRLACGDGGSREDLNLFTSISATVKSLFASAVMPATVDHTNTERDRAALRGILEKIIAAREEEASGARGNVVVDARANRDRGGSTVEHEPPRLQLQQQQPDAAPTSPATADQPQATPGVNSTQAFYEWIENGSGGGIPGGFTRRERFER